MKETTTRTLPRRSPIGMPYDHTPGSRALRTTIPSGHPSPKPHLLCRRPCHLEEPPEQFLPRYLANFHQTIGGLRTSPVLLLRLHPRQRRRLDMTTMTMIRSTTVLRCQPSVAINRPRR